MRDQELLTNFLTHRDESAFEALVLRYGPMVLRVCRDVLDRPADAEDAFQATFLVMFRQASSIRDRASVGRWLCEVAWRISRRERRRVDRLRSLERQARSMEAEARPEFDPAVREIRPILQDEIRLLPSRLRDPILLCYFEGLTVEDVARRLGVPLGTIKSRLARGRERLRSRLTRRGVAASTLLLLMFGLTEEVPAAVPSRLVSSTVENGLRGRGASERVASMVREEELGRFQLPSMAYWAPVLLSIVVFGAFRLGATQTLPAVGPARARSPKIFAGMTATSEASSCGVKGRSGSVWSR